MMDCSFLIAAINTGKSTISTFQNRVRSILKIVSFSSLVIVHFLASGFMMVTIAFDGSGVDFAPILEERPFVIGMGSIMVPFGVSYLLWRKVCFVE